MRPGGRASAWVPSGRSPPPIRIWGPVSTLSRAVGWLFRAAIVQLWKAPCEVLKDSRPLRMEQRSAHQLRQAQREPGDERPIEQVLEEGEDQDGSG